MSARFIVEEKVMFQENEFSMRPGNLANFAFQSRAMAFGVGQDVQTRTTSSEHDAYRMSTY